MVENQSPYSIPPQSAASKVAVVAPVDHAVSQYYAADEQPIVDYPMEDLSYSSTVNIEANDISKLLAVTKNSQGFTNNYGNSSQVLISADRIILNTKRDYLMLFGEAGVAISSKNPVNIDSDSSVTVAAADGIFLGVPNNGEPYDLDNQKKPSTKGDPTTDQAYEPVPLGIKLANLLEDLFVILKNARIVTPMGLAYFREDTQFDMANLQARLPEILSSLVFVDGISHESTDPAPKAPTTVTVVEDSQEIAGAAVILSSNITPTTGTNPAGTTNISQSTLSNLAK